MSVVERVEFHADHDQSTHGNRHGARGGASNLTDIYGGSIGHEYQAVSFTTANGVTFTIESDVETSDDGSEGSASGMILNADGEPVGTFTRQFDFDGGVVYNEALNIDADHQGQGIGTAFLDATEPNLANMGITQFRVTAVDVGRLAWAARGYRLDPSRGFRTEAAFARDAWAESARTIAATLDPATAAKAEDVLMSWSDDLENVYPVDLLTVSPAFRDVFLNGPSWDGERRPANDAAWDDYQRSLAATGATFHAEHDQSSHGNWAGGRSYGGDRTGDPIVDAVIEAFLNEPAGDWTTDDTPIGALDAAACHGACDAVARQFVDFAKARGLKVYATQTDADEMGYEATGTAQGEVMDADGNTITGHYFEHTVNEIYVDGRAFPYTVDFTARQYGYDTPVKVTFAATRVEFHGDHDQSTHGNWSRGQRLGPKHLNDNPHRFTPPKSLSVDDVTESVNAMLATLTAERADGVTFAANHVTTRAANEALGWQSLVTVNVEMRDANGQRMGSVNREITPDTGEMYAASLQIHPEWHGRGVGTQVQEAFEDWAAGAGIHTVKVDAMVHGRYVWARAGYDFQPSWSDLDKVSRWLETANQPDLAERVGRASAEIKESRSRVAAVPEYTPTPWEIAEAVGRDEWINRGPSWQGVKRLRVAGGFAASGAVSRQAHLDRVQAAYDEWWPRYPGAAEGAVDPVAEAAWDALLADDTEFICHLHAFTGCTTCTEQFHAEHDQSTHGNWATGRSSRSTSTTYRTFKTVQHKRAHDAAITYNFAAMNGNEVGQTRALTALKSAVSAVGSDELGGGFDEEAADAMRAAIDSGDRGEIMVTANTVLGVPFTNEFDLRQPDIDTIRDTVEKIVPLGGGTVWRVPGDANVSLYDSTDTLLDGQAHEILEAAVAARRFAPEGFPDIQPTLLKLSGTTATDGRVGWVNTASPNHVNLLHEFAVDADGIFERPPSELISAMPSARYVSPVTFTVAHEMAHSTLYVQYHEDKTAGRATLQDVSTLYNVHLRSSFGHVSEYGRSAAVEMHAEVFAEWVTTNGSTNNPVVLDYAATFGWRRPNGDGVFEVYDETRSSLAASGALVDLAELLTDRVLVEYGVGSGGVGAAEPDDVPRETFHLAGQHNQKSHGRRGASHIDNTLQPDLFGGYSRTVTGVLVDGVSVKTLFDLERIEQWAEGDFSGIPADPSLGDGLYDPNPQRRRAKLAEMLGDKEAAETILDALDEARARTIYDAERGFSAQERAEIAAAARGLRQGLRSGTFEERFQVPPLDTDSVDVVETSPGVFIDSRYPNTSFEAPASMRDSVPTVLAAAARAREAARNLTTGPIEFKVKEAGDDGTHAWVEVPQYASDRDIEHRTVYLTPKLVEGATEPSLFRRMASANVSDYLAYVVQHEIGHSSFFESVRSDGSSVNDLVNRLGIAAGTSPLISDYGRTHVLEVHAEAFAEWSNTGGTTNNPIVREFAAEFGWRASDDLALAASAGRITDGSNIVLYHGGGVLLIETGDMPIVTEYDNADTFTAERAEFHGNHDQSSHGNWARTARAAAAAAIIAQHPTRIPLAAIGIQPAPADLAHLAESTRDDDVWDAIAVTQVSADATFYGTETDVGTKHIAKVVNGVEPLREGYAPRLYQLDDGAYLIADGHHRLAMHVLMGTPGFDVHVRRLPAEFTAARVEFHAEHDQSSHGNWATGGEDRDDDYHGNHRPTDTGPRAHDLLEGEIAPGDVYDKPQWYTGYSGVEIQETMRQLRAVRGNPDGQVRIYRAAPDVANPIRPGDWVTLSRTYAETHAVSQSREDHELVVHELDVPAATVRWAVDDLMEFGYFPEYIDELRSFAVETVTFHAEHDQSTHGNWATGGPDRGPVQARALVDAAPPIVRNKATAEHVAAIEALQSVGRGIYEDAYSTLTAEQVSILNGAPTLDPDIFPKEHDAIRRVEQVLAERTLAALRAARPFGRDAEFTASGDPEFAGVVEAAAAMYPTAWMASSYGVRVEASGTTGGWYDEGTIGLPKYGPTDPAGIPRDTSKKLYRAAVHELGHHLEVENPSVLKAAQMFLATRKQGAFKPGSAVGVPSKLKVVDGEFRNSYSGVFYGATDIGGSDGTEVLTTHMYSLQFALDGPSEPNWSIQDVSLFAPPRVPSLRDAWLDETHYALGVLASL
jgi:GNAT superfamily N-acetyltransferase